MSARMLAYVRVSTADQAAYGYGLDAQIDRITQAYALRGWGKPTRVFRDEGASGKSLDRPGLMEALALIAAGKADGLVVAKLDRLTRSAIDFAMLLEWFGVAGATLVALDFDLDTSTPSGRMIAQMMSVISEWERETIASRTKDGLAAARAQGKPIGRPAVVDRPEVAERIRRLREDGFSLQAICDKLNEEGVATARGAGEWRKSAVQSILGYKRRPQRRKIANLPEIRRASRRTS